MSALHFGCVSHEGRTHAANEDRWLADPEQGLFLVTDGMANDIAPEKVIRRVPELFRDILATEQDLAVPSLPAQIQERLNQLNIQVRETMRRAGELGLGATLVLTWLRGGRALIAHLGDSRIYLCRNGELRRLTRDHSFLQDLIARGVVAEDDVLAAGNNGGPSRYFGMAGASLVDIQVLELQTADRLLLCSDGLTAMLRDEEIRAILVEQTTPQQACQALVDGANAAGGLDNVTVLVIANNS